MKLVSTLILLISAPICMKAQLVTFNGVNVEVRKVLDAVTNQTHLGYMTVPSDLLDKLPKVSIHATNKPFMDVLDSLEKQIPAYFTINETRTIVLRSKEMVANTSKRINIWGTVLDQFNEPVPRVLVFHFNSNQFIQTNEDGRFNLTNVAPYTIIRLSSHVIDTIFTSIPDDIIFKINVTRKKTEMLPQVDVIHTGYPNVIKRSFTGSALSIGREEMKQIASPFLKDYLEGRLSGLQLIRNKVPGVNMPEDFMLGGRSTVYANPNPLIILDNFPFEGSISEIDPNDILSITVLKDAVAASQWGIRAANGVIVITTKSGMFNKSKHISFNTYASIGSKPDIFYLDRISPADKAYVDSFLSSNRYYSQMLATTTPAFPPIAEDHYANKLDSNLMNYYRSLDIRNDIERLFYRKSQRQHYSIQMSDGGQSYAYQISTAYDRTLSEVQEGKENRFNIRLNNSYRPIPGLEISGTVSHTYYKRFNIDGIPATPVSYSSLIDSNGNPAAQYYIHRKTFVDTAGYDAFGISRLLDWKYYPLTEFYLRNRTYITKDTRIQGSIIYKNFPWFFKGLEAAIYGQYQNASEEKSFLHDKNSFYVRDIINSFTEISGSQPVPHIPWGNILDEYYSRTATLNLRYILTYNRKWRNQNSLNVMLGRDAITSTNALSRTYTYKYNNENGGQTNLDYLTRYPQYHYAGNGEFIPNYNNAKEINKNFYSYYSIVNLGFKSKYFISSSVRIEKANIYGLSIKYKNLPVYSLGTSYLISSEDWYKFKPLQELKLRASIGTMGNTPQNVSAIQTVKNTGINVYGDPVSYITSPPLPSLRWEKVRVLNLGVQFQSIRKIIEGSFDLYMKKSTDVIGFHMPDPTTGISSYSKNVSALSSQQIDINLTSRNMNGDFKWSTKLLFSWVKDEVIKTQDTLQQAWVYCDQTRLTPVPGRPLYGIYSFPSAGLDNKGEPVSPIKNKTFYEITTENGYASLNYHGRSTPAVYGALTNDFSYKGIDLSITLFYKLFYYFRKNSISYTDLYSGKSEGSRDFSRQWRKQGDEKDTYVPKMIYTRNPSRDVFYTNSSVLIRRADNIRVQNVTLSYSLKEALLKRIHIQSASIYLICSNPGILRRYNDDHIDPDHLAELQYPCTLAVGLRAALK